jgi:hypothetical protein
MKSEKPIKEKLIYSAYGPSDPRLGKVINHPGDPELEVLYGPIPLTWIWRAIDISGMAAILGVIIWHQSKLRKGAVPLTNAVCRKNHLKQRTVRQLLPQLESVGLVTVERLPSQAPRVSVVLPSEKKTPRLKRVK